MLSKVLLPVRSWLCLPQSPLRSSPSLLSLPYPAVFSIFAYDSGNRRRWVGSWTWSKEAPLLTLPRVVRRGSRHKKASTVLVMWVRPLAASVFYAHFLRLLLLASSAAPAYWQFHGVLDCAFCLVSEINKNRAMWKTQRQIQWERTQQNKHLQCRFWLTRRWGAVKQKRKEWKG